MILRILFTITTTVTLGITGGFMGSLLFKSIKGPLSLEGGAYVFWFICGGMLCGLITGIAVGRRLTQSSLKVVTVISTLIAVGLIAGIYLMMNVRSPKPAGRVAQPTSVSYLSN